MSVEETNVKQNGRFCVLKIGALMAVIYWLIATIRSTILIADSSFFVNIYYPGFWDLALRVITVASMIGASFYLQKKLNEVKSERDTASEELSSINYLIETGDCPVIELDHHLRIKHANKAAAVLTAIKVDDLEFNDVLSTLFYPENQEQIREFLEQSNQEILDRVVRIKARRMQKCYVTIRAAKELVEGKVSRQLLFLNDVTKFVTELESAEQRTATILAQLDQNPTPILLIDSQQIRFHNQAVQAAVQIPPEQITRETLIEFIETNCRDSEPLLQAIAKTCEESVPQDIETTFTIHGQERNLIIHLEPYGDEADTTAVWVRDITDLRALEHTHEQSISELAEQLKAAQANEAELRAEFEQHTNACRTERNQLIDELSSERQKNADLAAKLESLNDKTAHLESFLAERTSTNEILQDKLAQLQRDNSQLLADLDRMQEQWESILMPIMRTDRSGKLIKINSAGRRLLGISENELLQSYLAGEQPAKLTDMLLQLDAGEARVSAELEFVHNEQKIILSCHGIKLNKPEGQFLIYGYDVTAFRQAQRELALTLDNSRYELEDVLNEVEIERERMNAILAGINDGIVITDMYNRVIKMNPKAEDVLGIRLSQALERPVHFIIRNHEIIDHIQQTVREKLYNHEFTLEIAPPHEQSIITLDCTATVIHDRNLHDQGVIIQLRRADVS